MSASSIALAAEIVDVRVGQHPTFTRVVFELDSAAGYQLSKAAPGTKGEELVVILQATTIPRRVQAPRKSLLGLVRVSPDGRTAVARIELKKSGLVVKERIMSSPYRVVLDVIDPKAEAAAKKAVAKPAPKPKPKPAPKPTPVPVKPPAPKAVTPSPKPVAPAPVPAPVEVQKSVPEEDDLMGATGAEPAPPPMPQRMGQAEETRPSARRVETPEPSEGGIATMGQSDRTAPPKKPKSPPMAKMADTGDGGGLGNVIMIGGGALLAVFVALFLMRMRARKNRENDDDIASGSADTDDTTEDVNPFAAMGGESAPAPAASTKAGGAGPNLTLDSLVDEMPSKPPGQGDGENAAAEPDLGQTTVTARGEGGGKEPFSLTQQDGGPAVDTGVPPAMDTSGAADTDGDDEEIGEEEMSRLIQQFEQRIAALESKVDEQSEARERLERQVAAQTEELRVQRAAIARTQRAVRNLTRGEEDGPTEPAPREPSV